MFNTRKAVGEFNKAFGRPVHKQPQTELSPEDRLLIGKIVWEEVVEYMTLGLGLSIHVKSDDKFADAIDVSESLDLRLSDREMNIIECGDGLADINVTIHFAAHWQGLNLDALTEEVNDSNMSKLGADGQPIINGETPGYRNARIGDEADEPGYDLAKPIGKILKGPNFRLPNIAAVIGRGNFNMGVNPQIRFAVERALERARGASRKADEQVEEHGIISLQSIAWADEVESLDCAVDVLKGLE